MNLNLADAAAVRQAYRAIESSVTERVGRESFQGVTVQPMLKAGGYELIVGSTTERSSAPSLCLVRAGNWWRFIATAR